MGLFSKKKEEPEQVRAPVQKLDRSAYVQINTAPKKEVKKETKKTKTEKEDTMAEKKADAEPKSTAEKKPKATKKTETKPAAEKTTTAKVASNEPAAEKKESKPAAKKETKIWHITKRTEDNKWAVKAEGSTKATKLFNTKAEAEEFVKGLLANNEGSKVVSHKKDGKFQKR